MRRLHVFIPMVARQVGKRKRKWAQKRLKFWPLLVGMDLFLAACESPYEIKIEQTSREVVPGTNDTGHAIRTLQPALAVRGISCLMCHADVRANIITDFGYGDNWFLNADTSGIQDQGWFTDIAFTWQSAIGIQGTVFIPDAKVPARTIASLGLPVGTDLNVKQMMETPYPGLAGDTGHTTLAERNSEMAVKVTPNPGSDRVMAMKSITIRSFTDAEVLALAPELAASPNPTELKQVTISGVSADPFSGLNLTAGTGGTYFTNAPGVPIHCSNADVVIKGTLYLKDATIDADSGCRLYVAGTVFIEGPIAYSGSSPTTHNLQLLSSRAIVMGIDQPNLINRLVTDARSPKIRGTAFATRASEVLSEAAVIGSLKDASDLSSGYPTALSQWGATRSALDYTKVLFAAPMIHSRYLGKMQGTMIAEVALFSLGKFHFEFDPVFTQVDVFPLLTTSPLTIEAF